MTGGFFDCAGTPRLGGKSAWESGPRSRSGSIVVVPTTDETDDPKEGDGLNKPKPEVVKEVKDGEILGLCSPVPDALPSRTVKWAGQESFTWTEEPSRFFPEDACSDSSSESAEDDDGNESSESDESDLDRSDVNNIGEVMNNDEGCEETAPTLGGQQRLTLEIPSDTEQVLGVWTDFWNIDANSDVLVRVGLPCHLPASYEVDHKRLLNKQILVRAILLDPR